MVVKEHLDAGSHIEDSRCVVDRFTELDNQGFYAFPPEPFYCITGLMGM